jgi:23S rRNA (pseudouridine1915-N3)-methyltransferase
MNFVVLAVGQKQPAWVNAAFDEYARRMPREARVDLVEIKAEARAASRAQESVLKAERDRILGALPRGARLVVLDARGPQRTTEEFAGRLEEWLAAGTDTIFVIGGADGLHEDVKRAAHETLALSHLTLPHGLARILLVEQVYRAWTILSGHPYHRP